MEIKKYKLELRELLIFTESRGKIKGKHITSDKIICYNGLTCWKRWWEGRDKRDGGWGGGEIYTNEILNDIETNFIYV